MRLLSWMAVLPAVLAGQTVDAPGLVRGALLECDVVSGAGELSVRSASFEVFRFTFDRKTYFERASQRVDPALIGLGEQVEVVADRGSGMRYARTVHVVEPVKPPRPQSARRLRMPPSPIEHLVPTGNLTFSGVLSRVSAERLVLRGRDGTEQTIFLREDTRFLDGGDAAEVGNLRPNMRVFIRAGKDLYGQVEAYQIIRGGILQPQP